MMSMTKQQRALRALFDALDVDGNGHVDSKEWGRAVAKHAELMAEQLGSQLGGQESALKAIGQAFKKIDTDRSGTITWDEFERFVGVR